MRRFRACLLGMAVVISTPVISSQHRTQTDVSEEQAVKVFWKFSNCAVRRDPNGAAVLLNSLDWNEETREAANKFATRHRGCLAPTEVMQMYSGIFGTALAGALFVNNYKGKALPDYSGTPRVITEDLINNTADKAYRDVFLLRSFAECVFRANPDHVRSLLESNPVSAAENALFDKLMPMLGHCLPTKEGDQVRFSRLKLRSLLGQAAYFVDSARSGRPIVQTGAQE